LTTIAPCIILKESQKRKQKKKEKSMNFKAETTPQLQVSQLDELKSELEQVDKDLAQCIETMKKLNERAAELREKIKAATVTVSEPLKTEEPKQQEPATTNMTIDTLEKVFRSTPYYLDFKQLRRLAKGKSITVKGRTREAYINQIKAALAN
jgi:cell division septum initiation protein DivIVA